jgi:hypothetical protein
MGELSCRRTFNEVADVELQTLQELIAPSVVGFYAQNWEYIGDRATLCQEISQITRIDAGLLCDGLSDSAPLSRFSVAQRMSWAAGRKTTRPEDIAYCVMGIFGVNMVPLYGEGAIEAFYRLQVEIITTSVDDSIFAWGRERDVGNGHFFADSPDDFWHSSKVVKLAGRYKPTKMTNKGLKMKLRVLEVSQLNKSDIVGSLTNFKASVDDPKDWELIAALNCHIDTDFRGQLCLRLHSPQSYDQDLFYRVGCSPIVIRDDALTTGKVRTVYMGNHSTRLPELYHPHLGDGKYFYFEIDMDALTQSFNPPQRGKIAIHGIPGTAWSPETKVLRLPAVDGAARGAVTVSIQDLHTCISHFCFAVFFDVQSGGHIFAQVFDTKLSDEDVRGVPVPSWRRRFDLRPLPFGTLDVKIEPKITMGYTVYVVRFKADQRSKL